jgi:hypothetical protein
MKEITCIFQMKKIMQCTLKEIAHMKNRRCAYLWKKVHLDDFEDKKALSKKESLFLWKWWVVFWDKGTFKVN